MRTLRFALAIAVFAALPVLADSFNASLLHDQLLSDNAGIKNQALSRLPLLSPGEQRQLVPQLVQALQSHDASAPRAAAALAVLGPAASDALPELVDALHIDEEAVTSGVAQAIVKIGSAAVKPLQAALIDSNFLVRRRAADILGKLGGAAKRAVPDLVLRLDDPQPEVSAAAQNTLVALGADAVPALSAALRKTKDTGRPPLILLLGKCGPAAAPVLIVELKKDENGFVRAQAATALGQIPAAAETSVPPLIAALSDLDDSVRSTAVDALGQLGEKAKAAIGPLVVSAHEDKEPLVRQKADDALAAVGKATHESLAGLTQAFGDTDEGVRQAVVAQLSPSLIPVSQSVPLLTNAAHDPSPTVRLSVVEVSGSLPNATTDQLTLLKTAMADAEPQIRAAAIGRLGQMHQAPTDAAALLTPALKDPNPELREKTIQALKALGPAGLPGLIQALQDSYFALSDEAGRAIVSIGAPALPLLEPLVGGPDKAASKRAASLIRRIGQKHRSTH